MSWASKEQKGELALMGASLAKGLFEGYAQESKQRRQKALADNHISKKEYDELYNEMTEYRSQVENLLFDTELGSKFRETEEAFLTIVKIIMYDLEHDFEEVIQNFNKVIDSEEFIENHKRALAKREERLDREFEEEMKIYEKQLNSFNSQSFLKRTFSSPPEKPTRRI